MPYKPFAQLNTLPTAGSDWDKHKSALSSFSTIGPKLKTLAAAAKNCTDSYADLTAVSEATEAVVTATKNASDKIKNEKKFPPATSEWLSLVLTEAKKLQLKVGTDAATAKATEVEKTLATGEAAQQANKQMMQMEARSKLLAQLKGALPTGEASGSVVKKIVAILTKAGVDVGPLKDPSTFAVEFDRSRDTVQKLIDLKPKAQSALSTGDGTTVEVYKKIQELARGQMVKAAKTAKEYLATAQKWSSEFRADKELMPIIENFGVLCNQLDVLTRVEQSTVLEPLTAAVAPVPQTGGEEEDAESPYETAKTDRDYAIERFGKANSLTEARDALKELGVPGNVIDHLETLNTVESIAEELKKFSIPPEASLKGGLNLLP
jgi:hypothetical protein